MIVDLRTLLPLVMLAACPLARAADESPAPPATQDWKTAEAGTLTHHVQLTFPDRFVRAGEAYFDPRDQWVIFQAIPVPPEGKAPDRHYSMYIAELKRDADENIVGLAEPVLISPPGSANTCGYFNPKQPWQVIFGSTLTPPTEVDTPGYQRGTRSYRWAFPAEMEVVSLIVPAMLRRQLNVDGSDVTLDPSRTGLKVLLPNPGYDAECSFEPAGRYIVYASQKGTSPDSGRPEITIDVFDTKHRQAPLTLIKDAGYNGGPFFSPDGSMICYRSDRKGDDLLQVYVAELIRTDNGTIMGVRAERRVTDNEHVNWAPFWHASGECLVYATSEVGHDNYEIFSVQVPRGERASATPAELKKKRITYAPGFDGLPAFSSGSQWMMWTSQRGPKRAGEDKPSSQLWAARCVEIEP